MPLAAGYSSIRFSPIAPEQASFIELFQKFAMSATSGANLASAKLSPHCTWRSASSILSDSGMGGLHPVSTKREATPMPIEIRSLLFTFPSLARKPGCQSAPRLSRYFNYLLYLCNLLVSLAKHCSTECNVTLGSGILLRAGVDEELQVSGNCLSLGRAIGCWSKSVAGKS